MDFAVFAHKGPTGKGEVQELLIVLTQGGFFGEEGPAIKGPAVHPPLVVGHADVVKDRSARGIPEAGLLSPWFTHFLPEIEHGGGSTDCGREDHRRKGLPGVTGKPRTGNTLLVVVLQKMKHVVLNVFLSRQDSRQMVGGSPPLDDVLQGIIKLHLVVEVVHLPFQDIIAVERGIVDFSQQESFWIMVFDG